MAHTSDGHCFQYRKGKTGASGDVIWVIESGRSDRRSGRLVLEGSGISNASTKPSTGWVVQFNTWFCYFPTITIVHKRLRLVLSPKTP